MFKKVFNKLFYSPQRFVEKHSNIQVDQTCILLKSCVFRFDGIKCDNKVILGKNSMLGCSFVFESDEGKIMIGDNTFINEGSTLISRKEISIGSNVTIAWGCTIYDHNSHSLSYKERQEDTLKQIESFRQGFHFTHNKNWNTVKSRKISIEDNVWIGFDSVVLSGVTIGEGAIVGAKSVVREDVEPWTVVMGNPAVVVKKLQH